jgi:hypothetical protein
MLRVLNLGAGVQSTTLYLWALDGLLQIDRAIFADTGDEPEAVYRHLDFLLEMNGPPIDVVRASSKSLGENLQSGMNATGQENQRHVAIPTFLKSLDGSAPALGRRQCTAEYKIRPIEQRVRDLCGLEKGERAKRAVPRSACVFCPFKSDAEWLHLQQSPSDWNHAVEIDRAIRDKTSLCTVGMRHEQFLHRSCVPLDQVQFVAKPPDAQKKLAFSTMDCEGMCGV